MAAKICEGLYLGGQFDAEERSLVDVSHILTVSSGDLKRPDKDKYKCKWVKVDDNIGQDLMSYFQECIDFIEDARKEKGVLVHCIAGVSRSATIVTAYLMWKENLTLALALKVVQRNRIQACPNNGFMYQLYLFEKMGNKLDPTNPEYKYFKLTSFAKSLREAGDKELKKEDLEHDPQFNANKEIICYKCKKCRRTLFLQNSLMSHHKGIGEAAFNWKGSVEVTTAEEVCKQSIFIEPIEWMLECIQVTEGKIHCPKCRIKLGSFNWFGEPCPCGRWVTPAFHVDTGKVDKTVPLPIAVHPIAK